MGLVIISALAVITVAAVYVAFKSGRKLQRPPKITGSADIPKPEPAKPPITDAEIDALRTQFHAAAMPAADMIVSDNAPQTPLESRLGGPVYLPAGDNWPLDKTGAKMIFIAQINFADMPKLPDFPESGVLQVFLPSEDLFGAQFDAPETGDIALLWHEALGETAVRHENLSQIPYDPKAPQDDFTPFETYKADIQQSGRALRFTGDIRRQPPSASHWQFENKVRQFYGRPFHEKYEALWDELESDRTPHYIGGHVRLTQSDFRGKAPYDKLDSTLLQLGSDDFIMWGDMGEAMLVINQDDLRAKRFDKAVFWWDCC